MEGPLTLSDLQFGRRIDKKDGDQLPGPSQGGSGDACGAGDSIVLDDQSLFSDAEYICFLSLEYSSVSFSVASQTSLQCRMNFPNFTQITERYQISNTAAALANAVLIDVGIITERQTTYVIDKNKLRRERQEYCEQICQY